MRNFTALILFALLSVSQSLHAQSVSELESRLKKATSKNDKMTLNYQIAEKLLASNPAKAAEYAQQATQFANEIGDKRREADAAYLCAEGSYRARDYKSASGRYIRSWNTARNYGLREIALNSTEKLQDIALKQNDFKEALKWSRETVNYLRESGGGGRSGGDAQRKLENQLAAIEADNRSLREQLAAATGQTQVLENTYQNQIKEVQEKTQQELTQTHAALSQATRDKLQADSVVRRNVLQLKNLSEEQMLDSIVRAQQEREIQVQKTRLAEAKLQQERSEALRNLLAAAAGFVLILATLFYMRFRAKKRMANELTLKNAEVEAEQKRSNDLLLNILPPAIAQELKTRNKVKAQKYDDATVMFVDFKGFTNVAERLSPESLVEELDFCFSNFDRIISQYGIENIKTIGDAYLCAAGLSDKKATSRDIVRAALEIQDFLLGLRAERMGQGLPYFEARIGIHTGPVVAGVVGAKKFAYDIWGDTVNVAARMEEACEIGRVNVSENTYWLTKYDFEWQNRGRVAAKNKGEMEMYYVAGLK
ncbi:MAG: adenylate/guanylate cyclase domain-containing protein [Saprospiraceae bacterium]|nr:adenylate/guanylate cyclase domain-containing protein [Saprospiraceae bacterium]